MKISAIIPTLDEAENIGRLLQFFQKNGGAALLEVIVVDGGSRDQTVQIAREQGAKIFISEKKSRAMQMNLGARQATGEVLYFVHADTLPPADFSEKILQAVDAGLPMGCFRYRFDSLKLMLKINAWFTRFNFNWCQGGDKTMFIRRENFVALGGFDEHFAIMEEYDFIRRAARHGWRIQTLPEVATVSARKYDSNSWLRVQVANLLVFNLFRLGVAPFTLKKIYRKILR